MASKFCVVFSLRSGLCPFLDSQWVCGCLEIFVAVEVMLCGCLGFVCVAGPLTFNRTSHRLRISSRIWQTRIALFFSFEKITFVYFACSSVSVCMCTCKYLCVCVMFVYVYVCVCGGQRVTSGSWFSPFPHVGPGHVVHTAIGFVGRNFYLPNSLTSAGFS